jgi:nitrate/TMAO reductase-like tetraheme cytochrome c subunit
LEQQVCGRNGISKNINRMSYEELAKTVNVSYRKTRDIRATIKETGIPFDMVWDMTGTKDYIDFYDRES